MAERIVKVTATLELTTNVDLVLYDEDTPEEILPRCLYEGIKQYIKDYDPELGHSIPDNITITNVEEVGG